MSDKKEKKHDETLLDRSEGAGLVHVYDDDLVEEDNVLPLWWQYTLYGAVVFAAAYWYAEHHVGAFASQDVVYQQEMISVRLEQAKKNGGALPPDALIALSKTPATVEQGKQVFISTCAACHRADGGGNIGPNLTDNAWIHGGKPENIYQIVREGVAAKGMPAWGPQLGEEKVAAATAYVLTLKGHPAPGGKLAQGEPEQ